MKYYVKIFLPLLVICALTAGLVSGVHMLTADRIAENERAAAELDEAEKLALVAEIYGEVEFSVAPLEKVPDGVVDARLADSGEVCVTVICDGYQKESIKLFVAFDGDGAILRVRVLSSNETTGIGSKVNDASYLSGYEGKRGTLTFGDGIDKIAGATLSSRGVLSGINTAAAARDALLAEKKEG